MRLAFVLLLNASLQCIVIQSYHHDEMYNLFYVLNVVTESYTSYSELYSQLPPIIIHFDYIKMVNSKGKQWHDHINLHIVFTHKLSAFVNYQNDLQSVY